jgi:hypothetical protein
VSYDARVFVRACRSATIRTRLDVETVRERLTALAERPEPSGFRRLLANAHFDGWSVGLREFHLDYRVNNVKNPQAYSVHGTIQDERDWRIIRLKLTAHDPWLGPVEALFLAAFAAFHVYTGEVPAKGGVVVLVFVMAVYAVANLLYIPDVVTNRLSSLIASEVSGSVRQARGGWLVPTSD